MLTIREEKVIFTPYINRPKIIRINTSIINFTISHSLMYAFNILGLFISIHIYDKNPHTCNFTWSK